MGLFELLFYGIPYEIAMKTTSAVLNGLYVLWISEPWVEIRGIRSVKTTEEISYFNREEKASFRSQKL